MFTDDQTKRIEDLITQISNYNVSVLDNVLDGEYKEIQTYEDKIAVTLRLLTESCVKSTSLFTTIIKDAIKDMRFVDQHINSIVQEKDKVLSDDTINFYNVKYIKNYDGDTLTVDIKDLHPIIGKNMHIRLRGIDTPEIRGESEDEKKAAIVAKEITEKLCRGAARIDLLNVERGKYFRFVADVRIDGECLVSKIKEQLK